MTNDKQNQDLEKLQQEIVELRSQLSAFTQSATEPIQVLQQKALLSVVTKIRESLELQSIFDSTATEVRQLLNVDRVAVYRFTSGSNYNVGKIVAEDVLPPYTSALDAEIEDHCFGNNFASCYEQGKIWAAANIYDLGLQDCHLAILAQFQVKANLVVPLHQSQQLWGLLCIHHCATPHQWQETEIDFVQQIAGHLSVALEHAMAMDLLDQQSKILSQAVAQAVDREIATANIINKIRGSLNINEIFAAATEEVRELLQGDRVAIFQFNRDWSGQFVYESKPEQVGSSILQNQNSELPRDISRCSVRDLNDPKIITDTHLQNTSGGGFSTQDLYRVRHDVYAENFPDCYLNMLAKYQVRAYIIVAIYRNERLWGLLGVYQNSPRQWQESEIRFVVQIGANMGVALVQAGLFNQSKQYALQLEDTLQKLKAEINERTRAELREKATAKVVNKIRRSLEIEEIFSTTTLEVRQLLDVDRVAIYQFNPDWSGEFVAESVSGNWSPLVDIDKGIKTSWEDEYLQETKGGRYANHETYMVNDIYKAGHSECHVEMLEQFQIRAYSIAPIFSGDKLWGLLAAYQHAGPRQWRQSDVNFLGQIAEQFSIALQQAKLLQQTQQRSQELEKALIQLQVEVQERKKAEHVAKQALIKEKEVSQLKSKLISTISHELRTPLSLITLIAESLESRYHKLSPENRAIKFAKIKFNVSRIIRVVEDALTINRTDSVEANFSPVVVNLEDICQNIITEWQRDHTNLHVNYAVKGQHPVCARIDPELLKQLISQLLANAARYTPNSDAIFFDLLDQGKQIAIQVTDHGIGIPEAEQTKIFEQFYRATNADLISGTPGAGLGLAIVAQITRLHHGNIQVQSELDKGSTFTVRLPKNLP
jgi:GAF domain-containing protein